MLALGIEETRWILKDYTAATYGDRLADVYDSFYRPVNVEERMDVLEQLATGGRALELGIGTGEFALPLAARGVDVHGIDISEAMVEQMRAKEGGTTLPATIGDFADVEVEGTFSLILRHQQHPVHADRAGGPGSVL